MRYIRFIPLLLLLLTVASCYDENTFRKQIDLPSTPAKIVVFGYLSPENDTIRIYVGKSIAINDTVKYGDNVITNATVKLSCEGKEEIVPWRNAISYGSYDYYGSYSPGIYYEGGYKIAVRDFPLPPGKKIDLTVTTDMGTVRSSCVIPNDPGVIPVLDKVWLSSDNQYSNEINANVILKNFDNNQEYYHFFAELGKIDPSYPTLGRSAFDIKTGSEFSTHKPTDAQEVKYRLNRYYYQGNDPDGQEDSIYIYLAKTDEAYYKFNTTYKNYQDTDGNPFAEPVIVYSNIQGGLGVFCAFRLKKYSYPLKDYIQ